VESLKTANIYVNNNCRIIRKSNTHRLVTRIKRQKIICHVKGRAYNN